MYRVREKYRSRPKLIAWLPNETRKVNLLGVDVVERIDGNRLNPPRTITIRAATQKEMALIFQLQEKGGTNIIEYIADASDEEE